MNLQEIEEFCLSIGQSKFRAKQIYNWIYLKSVNNIDDMTDLSKKFRDELKELAVVSDIKIAKKQVSSDGTIKFLLEFPDGETIIMEASEGVIFLNDIPYLVNAELNAALEQICREIYNSATAYPRHRLLRRLRHSRR